VRAVVGAVQDDGVVGNPELVEEVEQFAERSSFDNPSCTVAHEDMRT